MPKKSIVLLPETTEILEQMGLQIKYARLRRKISAERLRAVYRLEPVSKEEKNL